MPQLKITVKEGQTIYDLAVQYLGHLRGAYWLAERNNLPMDTELVAGQSLEYLSTDIIRPELVQYFIDNNIDIATGGTVITPSPVLPPYLINELYRVSVGTNTVRFGFRASAPVRIYYAAWLSPFNASKGEIKDGLSAVISGSKNVSDQTETVQLGGLSDGLQYDIFAYLEDEENSLNSEIYKLTVKTDSIIVEPEPDGEALPYALPFVLENI